MIDKSHKKYDRGMELLCRLPFGPSVGLRVSTLSMDLHPGNSSNGFSLVLKVIERLRAKGYNVIKHKNGRGWGCVYVTDGLRFNRDFIERACRTYLDEVYRSQAILSSDVRMMSKIYSRRREIVDPKYFQKLNAFKYTF